MKCLASVTAPDHALRGRGVEADGVLGHALDRSSQCQCRSWSAGEVAKVEGRSGRRYRALSAIISAVWGRSSARIARRWEELQGGGSFGSKTRTSPEFRSTCGEGVRSRER